MNVFDVIISTLISKEIQDLNMRIARRVSVEFLQTVKTSYVILYRGLVSQMNEIFIYNQYLENYSPVNM